jgi:hypothetical protein
MKNVKQTMMAMTMALTFSSLSAFAGGVGNGGVSVVCRNLDGTINSAQVLDIYEGEVRFGRKYDNDLSADTKVELAQLKLTKYSRLLEDFQEELSKVKAIMTFIPKGNRLVPTNDAFPQIVKVGCDFEQLANYTDDGELLVSQEIYNELDEVNKAALLVHETVYAIYRKYRDEKNSQLSRKLTAYLLAKNPDQKIINATIEEGFNGNQTELGKRVCGTNGSVQNRIKHCNERKDNYALVARTVEEKEVWKDLITGLVWSDRLPSIMNHYNAEKACNAGLAEVAGISGVTWRLPSKEEYEEAEKNGIRRALPNMNYWFWSSSVLRYNSDGAWLFYGSNVYTGHGYGHRNSYDESVRCVAR